MDKYFKFIMGGLVTILIAGLIVAHYSSVHRINRVKALLNTENVERVGDPDNIYVVRKDNNLYLYFYRKYESGEELLVEFELNKVNGKIEDMNDRTD